MDAVHVCGHSTMQVFVRNRVRATRLGPTRIGLCPTRLHTARLRRVGRGWHAALVGVAILLAGCQTTPPNAAVPIPTGYKAKRSGAAAAPPETWVRGFGSGELNRLVGQALTANLDIEAAIARINQAEAQADVSRAALLPLFGSSFDASRQQSSATTRGTNLGAFGGGGFRSNNFSLGLNASYVLDLFGRNRYATRAADEAARANLFDRDTIALTTVASVANTYFTVLSGLDRLRIAEENLRIAQRVLEALRGRVSVGTGTALDVAQQESVVATQRAALPPLNQQIQQNTNALAVLIARPPETLQLGKGTLDRLNLPGVRPGLPSDLLLRRPDIARDEANLSSAVANVASARAAFFPQIQLTGGSGLQSAALASLLTGSSAFWSVAAGVTQPIFDASLPAQLGLQSGRAAELAATYKKTIIQAFTDVENALVAVRETTEHELRLREAVAASRRALDITEQRLREGTIDITTVFQVQTTLFGNEDALATVRLQRFEAYVSLYQALGGGWTAARSLPVAREGYDWRLRP